jgi:hypothetical protein
MTSAISRWRHRGVRSRRQCRQGPRQRHGIAIDRAALQFGGIIGAVELVDVVTCSASPWFRGPLGWVLREPRALPFMPARGLQRLFDLPAHPLLGELAVQRIDDRLF